jgi:hypothetical protein
MAEMTNCLHFLPFAKCHTGFAVRQLRQNKCFFKEFGDGQAANAGAVGRVGRDDAIDA